jgi:ubiquitin-protein ligase
MAHTAEMLELQLNEARAMSAKLSEGMTNLIGMVELLTKPDFNPYSDGGIRFGVAITNIPDRKLRTALASLYTLVCSARNMAEAVDNVREVLQRDTTHYHHVIASDVDNHYQLLVQTVGLLCTVMDDSQCSKENRAQIKEIVAQWQKLRSDGE